MRYALAETTISLVAVLIKIEVLPRLYQIRPLYAYAFTLAFYPSSLKDLRQFKTSCECFKELDDALMDRGDNYVMTCLPRLLALLQRGLGSRVDLVALKLQQDQQVRGGDCWIGFNFQSDWWVTSIVILLTL